MYSAYYKTAFALLLGVGALAAATGFATEDTKVKNCCEAKQACCAAKRACCTDQNKAGCCAQGMTCCKNNQACCDKAPQCCKDAKDCCKEGKACCGTKGDVKAETAGCCTHAEREVAVAPAELR